MTCTFLQPKNLGATVRFCTQVCMYVCSLFLLNLSTAVASPPHRHSLSDPSFPFHPFVPAPPLGLSSVLHYCLLYLLSLSRSVFRLTCAQIPRFTLLLARIGTPPLQCLICFSSRSLLNMCLGIVFVFFFKLVSSVYCAHSIQ